MKFLDGNKIASELRNNLKERIKESKITPTLAIIASGRNEASQVYIDKKIKACQEVGIDAFKISVESEPQLYSQIISLNKDKKVNAYIMQLPLPGWKAENYFSLFDPNKDVDVFHPENVGLLVQGRPRFKPCTPHGIQLLLNKSGITVAGKKVCIINRSNVVGKPLSSMLIQECDYYANATVTVCHDKTPLELLKKVSSSADIVIVAVGKPNFLKKDMVNKTSVVIDVGITRVGKKIVGDVDSEVYEIVEYATPVPGGVGPMTVYCLLENVFSAAFTQCFTN